MAFVPLGVRANETSPHSSLAAEAPNCKWGSETSDEFSSPSPLRERGENHAKVTIVQSASFNSSASANAAVGVGRPVISNKKREGSDGRGFPHFLRLAARVSVKWSRARVIPT